MKTELTKAFAKKTVKKIVLFAFFMIVLTAVSQSISPIVSKEMALTQMQNSNEMFVLMNTYSKVRPIFNLIYAGIIIWFTSTIARDTYKFVKTINAEIEKEN